MNFKMLLSRQIVKLLLCFLMNIYSLGLFSQFAPAAGTPGSTAIHIDSIIWSAWANSCTVQRGFLDISNPGLGYVSSGTEFDACGRTTEGGVISLGDGGIATLSFPDPISNGPGFDFAVFENAFNQTFLELAFVEVSSDGNRFVRFPSFSNTDTSFQVGTFGAIDPAKIHNLAGKYRFGYGTPFDLDDLKDSTGIDHTQITHVRIIDVVGSIHPDFCSRDSRGFIINDPWNTPFAEGGFDLDGVGVIHSNARSSLSQNENQGIMVFPNPIEKSPGKLNIQFASDDTKDLKIYNLQGQLILEKEVYSGEQLDLTHFETGTYLLKVGAYICKIFIQ